MRRLCTRLAIVLLALAADAARGGAPVPPELAEAAARDGRTRVIVRLDAPAAAGPETPPQRALRRAAIASAAERVLARIGGATGLRRYAALPLLALEVSPRELAELGASADVLALEPDRPLWPRLAESVPLIGANLSTSAGYDGRGQAVVIVDTGVESTHPFFGGRVVAEACFSSGRDCPNNQNTQFGSGAAAPCTYGSECFHGTHVAGIAAGDNGTFRGVAPGASLIAIQAGSKLTGAACGGAGSPCVTIYTSDAIAALDYATDTLSASYAIAAVNMSFGSSGASSESSCDAGNGPFRVAIDAARAAGITSVAAAGNDSSTTIVDAPACISIAIAVGATLDTSDSVWIKSNSASPLDLWAPGTNICSSDLEGTSALRCWSNLGGTYAIHSGTSMSTPHVTGAFAVLRQADPGASVAQLKRALESTGVPVTDPRNGLVRPRIQVDAAVRSLAPAACFDGLDNDFDGRVDVDGNGGPPDPDCSSGFDTSESANPGLGCGIGPELAVVVGGLLALRRRARNRSPAVGSGGVAPGGCP